MNPGGGSQDRYIGLGVSAFVVIAAAVPAIAARIAGRSRKAITGRKAAMGA